MQLGCRDEVLLTCLTISADYDHYFRMEHQPAESGTGAPGRPPAASVATPTDDVIEYEVRRIENRYEPPPDHEEREKISSKIQTVIDDLETHYDVLCAFGRLDPPHVDGFVPEDAEVIPDSESAPATLQATARAAQGTTELAEAALARLLYLLRWSRRLFTTGVGNAATIGVAGLMPPCVYASLVARQHGKKAGPAVEHVADMLVEMSLLSVHDSSFRARQKQIAAKTARFERTYPEIYSALEAKIKSLHDGGQDHDGVAGAYEVNRAVWHQLLHHEGKRRGR